ncbi:MAG: lipopolysaccharide transport periplasmic protein LptA [Desulfobacterales bacterium]|nr:lipopolysaccharide transport periplasmic protein LptA [Desulfobacterales bacterium]
MITSDYRAETASMHFRPFQIIGIISVVLAGLTPCRAAGPPGGANGPPPLLIEAAARKARPQASAPILIRADSRKSAPKASTPGPKKAPDAKAHGRTPLLIEADRMESRQQDDLVLFTGRVEARQGDITITAREMTVSYLPQNVDKPGTDMTQRIRKLTARGNVTITKGKLTASGDTMEFFAREQKVVLFGNAKAWQDKNMVTGDRITLLLDQGTSVVERSGTGTGRVKAYIYPDNGPGQVTE